MSAPSELFPLCFQLFNDSIGWRLENQYSNIQRASQGLLDFKPPRGLSMSSGKSISDNFKSQFSYAILPSQTTSIGYLATSRPLAFYLKDYQQKQGEAQILQSTDKDDAEYLMAAIARGKRSNLNALLSGIRDGSWRTNWDMFDKNSRDKKQTSTVGDYLMMAQMTPGSRSIAGQCICRINTSSLLHVKGLSVASGRQNLQLVTHFIQERKRWCAEYSFASHGSMFGIHGMYNLGDFERVDKAVDQFIHGSNKTRSNIYNKGLNGKVSIGGEAYFGLQNASPGASVGIRYRQHIPLFAELCCMANPLMGHITLSYLQDLNPDLTTAARYKFNYYSLNSDICVGTEWRSGDKSILKASIGTDKGLQLLLDTRLRNMIVTVGLSVDRDKTKLTSPLAKDNSNPGPQLPPKLSVGMQFQAFI